MNPSPAKYKLKKTLKWALLLSISLLVFFLMVSQLPFVQRLAVNKTSTWLTQKTGAEVSIGFFRWNRLHDLELKEVFVADNQSDTLLYLKQLDVTVDFWSLLTRQIMLESIDLQNAAIFLDKNETGVFNFNHFIEAFASSGSKNDSATTAWEIGLSNIHLQKVRFTFKDQQTPQSIYINIGDFNALVRQFSLQDQSIEIDQLSLKESLADLFYQQNNQESAPAASSNPLTFPDFGWTIQASAIELKNNQFNYQPFDQKTAPATFDPGHLNIYVETINLRDLTLDKEKIAADLRQLKGKVNPDLQFREFQSHFLIDQNQIRLDEFYLKTGRSVIEHDTRLSYQQFSELGDFIQKVGIESNLKNLNIHPQDIRQFVAGVLAKDLKEPFILSGKWQGTIADAQITALDLKHNQSTRLKLNGSLRGLPDLNQLEFDLDIARLQTTYSELSSFLPPTSLPKGLNSWERIRLATSLQGKMNNLIAAPFQLTTSGGPQLYGRIEATGLPDIDKTVFKLTLDTFQTNSAHWKDFATGALPDMVDQLGDITAQGIYTGTIHQFEIDLTVNTALGKLSTNAAIAFEKDYSNATYKGRIELDAFDLGTFLQDSLFGPVSIVANLDGLGIQPEAINTRINTTLSSFFFKDYTYRNLTLSGNLINGMFEGDANIIDENLKFSFDGQIPLTNPAKSINFQWVLDTINLHHLNLLDSPLGMSANLHAQANQLNPDDWQGAFTIRNFNLSDGTNSYQSDSIVLSNKQLDNGYQYLALDADFLQADLSGKFQLTELPKSMARWVDNYFPVSYWIFPPDTIDNNANKEPPVELTFKLTLDNPEALTNWLLPELKQLDPFYVAANLNTATNTWNLEATSPVIRYGNLTLDDFQLTSGIVEDKIETNLALKQLLAGDSTQIPQPTVIIKLGNQQIETQLLSSEPETDSSIWQLASTLTSQKDSLFLKLDTDPILNGEPWKIDRKNTLTYIRSGDYSIQQLNFYQDDHTLLISGHRRKAEDSAQIDVKLNQVLLQNFTPLLGLPDIQMTGIINGQATIHQPHSNLNYTAQISLTDWRVDTTVIGDFLVDAHQVQGTDLIQIGMELQGLSNDLTVKGDYDRSGRRFNVEGKVDRLAMQTLDPFLKELIAESTGKLGGHFSLSGTPEKPLLQGSLLLQDASTLVDYTGVRYKINQGEINFSENDITFGKWNMEDAAGNPASLSGQLTHNYFQDIRPNLNFEAKNFRFFNTTAKDNELFYGKLTMDANVDITGTAEQPKFRVLARSVPETQFFVIPLSDEQQIASDDYIIFGKPKLDSLGRDTNRLEQYRLKTAGLDLSLDLTLTDEAEFQVIVDPLTGDKLVCRGNADLSVDVTETGEVNIYGTYEVKEGQYNFSYEQLIKREFVLLENSHIDFSGDPLNARLDMRAAYQTRVPLSDLVDNLLTEEQNNARATARRVDVRVLMKMTGNLSKPELSFDIELVGNPQGALADIARNRLQQLRNNPSELNTQVFGLLLFNSFIKENSDQSLSSAGEAVVWSSVSKLISGKLNKLADQYLKGVTVDIGIEAYKAGGTASDDLVTEVDLGVSKRLFNDRLTVRVGGNLNVGEESENSQEVAANFAGDFVLEYALTPTGNYQLRVYRRSDYDVLNQGNIIRSGAGFSLHKSFKGKRQRN